MPAHEIELRPFSAGLDSKRLSEWLQKPHVAQWWGDERGDLQTLLKDFPDRHAVILADGVPVGYLCWQRLPPGEREAAGLCDLPEGLVDIDILIGEPGALDQGIGSTALGLLLARLRTEPLASVAGVGTAVSNQRAIRAFEKAGFRRLRDFEDPGFGHCQYMVLELAGDPAGQGR